MQKFNMEYFRIIGECHRSDDAIVRSESMHSGLDRLRTPESCLIEPNKPRVPAMEPPPNVKHPSELPHIRRQKKWMCLGILVSKRDLNPRRDTSTPLAWNRYLSASIGSRIISFLSRAGQPAETCDRCLPLLKLSVPCRLDSEAKQKPHL